MADRQASQSTIPQRRNHAARTNRNCKSRIVDPRRGSDGRDSDSIRSFLRTDISEPTLTPPSHVTGSATHYGRKNVQACVVIAIHDQATMRTGVYPHLQ